MSENYDPEIYDFATPGTFRGDIDWYRRLARESGGPVLELGAGTGRVTIPIAEAGVSVCALDCDRGMLDHLRRKVCGLAADVRERLVVVDADMRSFRLEQRFALVISPCRAFLHNLTTDDQLACLRAAYAYLQPGGRIALNFFHPSLEYMAQHSGPFAGIWRWSATHTLADGGTLVRSDANRYDSVRQRVHSLIRYERYNAHGDLERTYLQRLELAYLYPQDIRHLLERAGFEGIEIAGDFSGRPFQNDADELVVTAARPSVR